MRNDEGGHLMPKNGTDWFRGIAAAMVILSHYAEWWTWFTPVEGDGAIIQLAFSKLGIYGVDIFFLLSGYAMVISLGQNPMNKGFIWKRIKNTYIPYFIVVGIIELISEGFVSLQDFIYFASGYDYWYMFVLFLFYFGFIIIYAIFRSKGLRVVFFCIFTYLFSRILYNKGMNDFWYVSNVAFALGVIAGEYENRFKKMIDKLWLPMVAILGAGMIPVIQWGLDGGVNFGQNPEDYQLPFQIGATVVWTLLVLVLSSKCHIKEKIFAFLGKYSLYLYLTHTYVFMQCVNNLKCSYAVRFAASAVITVVLSFASCQAITATGKLISKQKSG